MNIQLNSILVQSQGVCWIISLTEVFSTLPKLIPYSLTFHWTSQAPIILATYCLSLDLSVGIRWVESLKCDLLWEFISFSKLLLSSTFQNMHFYSDSILFCGHNTLAYPFLPSWGFCLFLPLTLWVVLLWSFIHTFYWNSIPWYLGK